MGARCPGVCITDRKNMRMDETCWGQRRMEAPFEGGQGPKWAVLPHKDGWMDGAVLCVI
jgi:hypothetical protein